MKKSYPFAVAIGTALVFASLAVSHTASAQSVDGNPIGNLENVSCAVVSGWTYDPDMAAGPSGGDGGSTPGSTPDPNPEPDPGTPQEPGMCQSRYRWVNINAGTVDQGQGCAAVGAVPAPNLSPSRGICASGEDRPLSGYDVSQINYSRGQWGSGNGGGGTEVVFQNGGYRCYQSGQKRDKDNTDVAVAYYCDFGDSYPASCPYDDVPIAPVTYPPYGGGDGDENIQLNFKGFFDAILAIFAPLRASASSGDSNSAEIYDGPKDGGGTLIATVPANQARPDVNSVMGVSGNHGFSWNVPASLRDGQNHSIYVYGTNIESPGQTTMLSNSPQSLQCAPDFTNSAPSQATLTCPANGSLTNTNLEVSFRSTDADGNTVRYLVDWDGNGSTDQIVPPSGAYVAQNTLQSASKSWPSSGQKTVIVTAQDSNGANAAAASCTFTVADGPGDPGDGSGGGGGNGGGGSGGPGGGSESGFTISADKSKVQLQFLGSLSGTSEPIRIESNSFGGFSAPVTLRLVSVLSKSSGASLPAGTEATASFDGKPFSSVATTIQSYDGTIGRYRGEQNLIGSSFRITVSKAITESYVATIEGTSGSVTALFYLTLDPKATAPSFNEI